MLAPANRSLIIPRQRRNAERVCAPPSPGLAVFAAYFRLIPTTSTARARRNAARRRGGGVSPAETVAWRRASGDEASDMAALPCGPCGWFGVPRATRPPALLRNGTRADEPPVAPRRGEQNCIVAADPGSIRPAGHAAGSTLTPSGCAPRGLAAG